MSSPRRPLAALVAGSLLWVLTASIGQAAAPASARVVPHTVAMGKNATLVASRLPAGRYYDLVLVVGNANRARWTQFIPKLGKTDGHGNLRVSFRMPVVPYCGTASIYVNEAQARVSVRAPFVITGCKPAGHQKAPPPPPSRKHK